MCKWRNILTEDVRPTFVQYRRGVVILLDGYTYSKSDKVNWYCSRRTTASCKAKVKLTPDEKYIECLVGVHAHYRERFVVSPDGILIKLNTSASIVNLEFIPTRTGYLLLIDGYTYWKDARNKGGIYWYCSKRHQKCPAFVKTDHGHTHIIASSTFHNHEPRVYRYTDRQSCVY